MHFSRLLLQCVHSPINLVTGCYRKNYLHYNSLLKNKTTDFAQKPFYVNLPLFHNPVTCRKPRCKLNCELQAVCTYVACPLFREIMFKQRYNANIFS